MMTHARNLFLAAGLALAAVGCVSSTTPGPADMTVIGPPVDYGAETPADITMPGPTQAVLVAGDFNSPLGSLSTMSLADRSLKKNLDTSIDSDSIVRAYNGKVYVLGRLKGTLRIYDPAAGFTKPVEIVTGDGMVPHDKTDPTDVLAIPASSKLYVALYTNDANHAVGVIDSTRPGDGVVKWIAVPASAKTDLPRPTQLWFCGPLVYVLLEDLDKQFALTGPGRIAIIDPRTDKLVEDGQPNVITLMGNNPGGGFPYGMTRMGAGCDDVLVSAAGDLSGKTMDMGGIERVDLTMRKSSGLLFTGTDLKGNLGSITAASPHLLYAVVGSFPNKVVALDPTDKKVLGDVLGPASFIPFVQVTPDGKQVFIGINSGMMGGTSAGLYAAPADGMKITSMPTVLDQPPYGIAFF